MSYPSREQIFSALFAKFQTLVQFTTIDRSAHLPQDVNLTNQPILSLLEGNEKTTYDGRRLAKREFDAFVVIFFIRTDRMVSGSTVINPMIDAVRDLLQPNDLEENVYQLRDPTTNAVLVSWLRIEGTTVIETGDTATDHMGGALIPLKLLIP